MSSTTTSKSQQLAYEILEKIEDMKQNMTDGDYKIIVEKLGELYKIQNNSNDKAEELELLQQAEAYIDELEIEKHRLENEEYELRFNLEVEKSQNKDLEKRCRENECKIKELESLIDKKELQEFYNKHELRKNLKEKMKTRLQEERWKKRRIKRRLRLVP
jgi:hypothetical protein